MRVVHQLTGNTKMKRTRQDKTKDFDDFYNNSKETFENLRIQDLNTEKFQREYMLYVRPGSRGGGTHKRMIEVFWGARPYEFETQGNSWKALSEKGATLLFYRNDTGDITISIFPAYTDFRKPIETSITLYSRHDPKSLNNQKFVNSLWRDFMSYMEYTSLDGKPSLRQKIRIYYLRNFKPLIIDNKLYPTKFSDFYKDILKWVLSVGLSGFVFYLVTVLNQPKVNNTENILKSTSKQIEKISTQIEKISDEMKRVKNDTTRIIKTKK